jgi:hypothetical protein
MSVPNEVAIQYLTSIRFYDWFDDHLYLSASNKYIAENVSKYKWLKI